MKGAAGIGDGEAEDEFGEGFVGGGKEGERDDAVDGMDETKPKGEVGEMKGDEVSYGVGDHVVGVEAFWAHEIKTNEAWRQKKK